MTVFIIPEIKRSLSEAFKQLEDWKDLSTFSRGQIIDKTFKSFFEDLMSQFGMKPGIDYEDNLSDNAEITDFVALTKKADDLIVGLLEGKIKAISVQGHFKTSNLGKEFEVTGHTRYVKVS